MTGFVIEAIQNKLSARIGFPPAASASPVASWCSTWSFVTTTVTAPEISCASISAFIAAPTPGNVGDAAVARNGKRSRAAQRRDFVIIGVAFMCAMACLSNVSWSGQGLAGHITPFVPDFKSRAFNPPYCPPTFGISQGVMLQYQLEGIKLSTWPSRNAMALRPLCRGSGPPQLGSSPETPPVFGASSPTSCRIQQPGFSGVVAVTHSRGIRRVLRHRARVGDVGHPGRLRNRPAHPVPDRVRPRPVAHNHPLENSFRSLKPPGPPVPSGTLRSTC